MKIVKTIIHLFSIICYFLIGIYALICIPYLFKYKPLVVLTGSMDPTFKVGSIIYYKNVLENDIKKGDIITFKYDDSTFISHRVNQISNGVYETKGDANNTADTRRITYKNIVGKDLNFCIPYLGYYVKFINDNMYILIIISIILVTEFILSNFCYKKREEKYE